MRGCLVRDQYCCCITAAVLVLFFFWSSYLYLYSVHCMFLLRQSSVLSSPDCLAPSRHISMGVGVAAEPRRVAFTSCFGRDMVHPASHTWRLHKYQYLHAYFLGVWRLALDLTQGSDQRCGVGGQVDGGTRRGGAQHACRSDGSCSSAEGRRISGECLCDATDRPGR